MLEHRVDVAAVGRDARDRLAGEVDLARGRLLEARDHPQGRRLAAARWPEERVERPAGDLEVHVVDRDDVAEALRHAADVDVRRVRTRGVRGGVVPEPLGGDRRPGDVVVVGVLVIGLRPRGTVRRRRRGQAGILDSSGGASPGPAIGGSYGPGGRASTRFRFPIVRITHCARIAAANFAVRVASAVGRRACVGREPRMATMYVVIMAGRRRHAAPPREHRRAAEAVPAAAADRRDAAPADGAPAAGRRARSRWTCTWWRRPPTRRSSRPRSPTRPWSSSPRAATPRPRSRSRRSPWTGPRTR